MIVVSCNCRGLGSLIKVEYIKDIIKSERPDILMIQETKMVEEDVMALSHLHWKNYNEEAISSRGAYGGITTFIIQKNMQ